jgi:hypothetical protein
MIHTIPIFKSDVNPIHDPSLVPDKSLVCSCSFGEDESLTSSSSSASISNTGASPDEQEVGEFAPEETDSAAKPIIGG